MSFSSNLTRRESKQLKLQCWKARSIKLITCKSRPISWSKLFSKSFQKIMQILNPTKTMSVSSRCTSMGSTLIKWKRLTSTVRTGVLSLTLCFRGASTTKEFKSCRRRRFYELECTSFQKTRTNENGFWTRRRRTDKCLRVCLHIWWRK